MMSKCVLKVAGQEAKETCATEKLCRGMVMGIEGGVHVMCLLWAHHVQEEDWGLLIINDTNLFNGHN